MSFFNYPITRYSCQFAVKPVTMKTTSTQVIIPAFPMFARLQLQQQPTTTFSHLNTIL